MADDDQYGGDDLPDLPPLPPSDPAAPRPPDMPSGPSYEPIDSSPSPSPSPSPSQSWPAPSGGPSEPTAPAAPGQMPPAGPASYPEPASFSGPASSPESASYPQPASYPGSASYPDPGASMQPPAGSYPEPGQMPAYGQVPASPPPGGPGSPVGPGGPGFQPPSGGSSSRRGLGIAIAAVVGLFVLVGLGFVITTLVGRVEDSIEAQPDLNEATIEQLEEVTTDAELSRSDSDCIEDEMDGQATLNEVFTDTTGDAREAMVQAMLDCIPDPANSDLLVGSFGGNMELALDGQIEVDSEEGGCMVQYILDNSPNPARTLSEADGPQDAQILVESFELCLDEQDLALVTGAAGVGPQAYGDDPRLDLLHDDCGAGDDRACDVLYFQSSAESQYEDFALDCGGRGSAENGWCTADVDFDVNGEAAVDDPGLLAQLALCEQGDWTACDFVFMTAPFGSDVGDIGFTCGGEIPVGALPDCRTRLG